MRILALALFAGLAAAGPVAAQGFGPQPDAATRTELLALRESAWRTFFGNDRAGFLRVVPDELLAISWNGGAWQNREQILVSMGERAKSGEKLTTLEFPRNEFQQYGDVVIMYSTFHVILTGANGRESHTAGRGTEVFVKRNNKWIHTSWHLDATAN
jgi:ketosteroid isomerase-like protein